MNVTHIVGSGGTGKSTLAALMVADLEQRGARCAVVDADGMDLDYKRSVALAVAAHPDVDHLFLEWFPHIFEKSTDHVPSYRTIYIVDTQMPVDSVVNGAETQAEGSQVA